MSQHGAHKSASEAGITTQQIKTQHNQSWKENVTELLCSGVLGKAAAGADQGKAECGEAFR